MNTLHSVTHLREETVGCVRKFDSNVNPIDVAGVLSLDMAGPLKPANDVGGLQTRYFLAGTFTWLVPKNIGQKDPDDIPGGEGDDEGPEIDQDRVRKDDEEEANDQ